MPHARPWPGCLAVTAVTAFVILVAETTVASGADDEELFVGNAGEGVEVDESDSQAEKMPNGEEVRGTSAVYVMEHGFLSGQTLDWQPRGTLLLSSSSSSAGKRTGHEARLSDAKEFVQLRPELQQRMTVAAGQNNYYAIRMYSPESPRRVLLASIPAKLLANHFDDWHDILEVTVGAAGVPVALSYRVRHTLGLALFHHTQVRLSEPSQTEGPRIPAPVKAGAGPGGAGTQEQGTTSFLRKYWWVILIGLLLLSNATEDPTAAGKGGGGGGGGGGGRRAN